MEATKAINAESGTRSVDPTTSVKSSASGNQVKPGDVLLGRFMLMREIGRGGTSRVFRARDLLAVLGGNLKESDIAVKVAEIVDQPTQVNNSDLILREALTTRHLSHPNILKVYDYHKDGPHVFVTMELVDGEPLSELAGRYPNRILSYKQVVSIIDHVVAGLAAAHKAEIIHSDVKPGNILLGNDGSVKVIDFATSRSKLKQQSNDAEGHQSDYVAYTLAYASPQLLKDEPPAVSDDLYSLACVVYELLGGEQANSSTVSRKTTGRSSSDNKSTPKLVTFRPTKARRKPSSISHLQWRVLSSAMSATGCKRYHSVADFWHSFKQARRQPYYWVTAISAALIALVAGVYLMQRDVVSLDFLRLDNQASVADTAAEALSDLARLPLQERLNVLQNIELFKGTESELTKAQAASYSDNISDINELINGLLSYDAASFEAPEFNDALATISAAQTLYPDSLTLFRAEELVSGEREQYLNYLTVEYNNLWDADDYRIPVAVNLNTILRSAQRISGNNSLAANDEHAVRLIALMKSAITDGNFTQYYQYYVFAQTITLHANLNQALNSLESRYYPAAEQLIDYVPNDNGNSASYPSSAAELWAKPKLEAIIARLDESWKDDELNQARLALGQIVEDFKTNYRADFLQDVVAKLKDKYAMKIGYYKNKGYRRPLATVQTAYDELLTASQPVTE